MFLEILRNYLHKAIKENIDFNLEFISNFIVNVDETHICLKPLANTSFEKIGEKTIKIRIFFKIKKISCIFFILSNDSLYLQCLHLKAFKMEL